MFPKKSPKKDFSPKNSPLKRQKRKMYSHVLFKLKTHKFQKIHEQQRARDDVEKHLKPHIEDGVTIDVTTSPFINTHQLHTFAIKLKNPVKSVADLPPAFHNTLKTQKNIETYHPALMVLNENLEQQPTVEDCMATFGEWTSSLDIPTYETFGLKCIAARGEGNRNNAKASQFGELIRDQVVDYMKAHYSSVLWDRSPEIKAKLTELRIEAEAAAKASNKPYKRPTLNQIMLQLELATKVGFWFSETAQGGGAAKSSAEVQETQQKAWKEWPMEDKVGQRVVICKIGEIFLKKGNRGKFLWQLQTNLQFKLGGKASVKQQQYSFIISPPRHFQGRPFTSDELKEVLDIVRAVPGVDGVALAMKTKPTEEAMATTMQYIMALTALENNESCKTKPLKAATLVHPKAEYHDAVIQFLKGKNMPEEALSEEQKAALESHVQIDNNADRVKRRVKRITKRIEDVFHMGMKCEVSLNPPTYFNSRTALARALQATNLVDFSRLSGLPEGQFFMDPGRYQRYLRQQKALEPVDPLASDDECSVTYDDEDVTTTNITSRAAAGTILEDVYIAPDGSNTNTMNDETTSSSSTMTTNAESGPTSQTTLKKVAPPTSMWVKPVSGLEFNVEVHQTDAYISIKSDHRPSVGGQPTGTGADTNTVVCLLSGGMDSPVAAFSLMKRGMRVILVHFQNANLADEETVQNKIIQLSEHLSKYQITTYLHIVPFSAIQDAIITEVPSPARMLVYRRFMMSISAKIAAIYSASFLVVGDALGQVASQTPKNMYASYANAPLPLLSPLVGSNKNEIMDIAKTIGTYDISALPYGDCCSYFLAKHPLTAIEKDLLHQYEKNVGRAIDGGNEQLIADAQNASAVYRWHKPQDGMVSLRAMTPVQSYHDNAATNMLMSCPVNRGGDDDDDVGMADEVTSSSKERKDNKKRKNEDAEGETNLDLNEEHAILQQQKVDVKKAKQTESLETEAVELDVNKQQMTYTNNVVAYLDSASTTRVLPTVMNAVQRFTTGQLFGNSSSLHVIGKTADLAVKQATTTLLGLLNAHDRTEEQQLNVYGIGGDERMVYTSGGTEANNLAIFGSLKHAVQKQIDSIVTSLGYIPMGQKLAVNQSYPTNLAAKHPKKYILSIHLISSGLEHSAILEPLELIKKSPDMLISNRYGLNIAVNVILNHVNNDNIGIVSHEHLQRLLSIKPHVNNKNEIVKNTGFDPSDLDTELIDVATFCSIMHANNEIGTIQPIDKIGKTIAEFKQTNASSSSVTLFHTDACQSFGKVNIDVQHCDIDLLTLNGHKLHGVKGVGALYIRPTVKVSPVQVGGGHQHGIRSGTLNIAGIVAMQHAATYCHSVPANVDIDAIQQYVKSTYKSNHNNGETIHDTLTQHGKEIRQKQLSFLFQLKKLFPKALVNGPNQLIAQVFSTVDGVEVAETKIADLEKRINDIESDLYTTNKYLSLPSVLSILFDPSSQLDSPGIVKYLSTRGVCVSAGSACASNNSEPKPSHVLKGIGMQDQHSNGTVRISFSVLTSQKELDNALIVFGELAKDLHTIKSKKPSE